MRQMPRIVPKWRKMKDSNPQTVSRDCFLDSCVTITLIFRILSPCQNCAGALGGGTSTKERASAYRLTLIYIRGDTYEHQKRDQAFNLISYGTIILIYYCHALPTL